MRPIALAVLCLAAPVFAQSTATYRVRFDAEWSVGTHPGAYPPGAHFSPLVGAVHSDRVHFWEHGGIATDDGNAARPRDLHPESTSSFRTESGKMAPPVVP